MLSSEIPYSSEHIFGNMLSRSPQVKDDYINLDVSLEMDVVSSREWVVCIQMTWLTESDGDLSASAASSHPHISGTPKTNKCMTRER